MTRDPSPHIWDLVAQSLRCDTPTIRAVFEVEAAGKFFEDDGTPIHRFEPHHFPREHWALLGFAPGNEAPWRASLKVKTSARDKMFQTAVSIDREAAYRATSWGAPQTMGFNSALAGFASAGALVEAYRASADNQIWGFAAFCEAAGLVTHLRSQDWLAFAAGYNGSGQAAVYAAKIETAYRRHSLGGHASASILRLGMSGAAVEEMQRALRDALRMVNDQRPLEVDGTFGHQTLEAVKAFQELKGLKVDGIVGATTQRALERTSHQPLVVSTGEQPTTKELTLDKVIQHGTAVVGTGGVASLVTGLNDYSQTILVGGVVVAALVVGVVWFIRRK